LTLLLLLRTIRNLRKEQIAFRPLRVAQFRLYRTFPILTSSWRDVTTPVPEIAPQTIEKIRSVFESSFAHLNLPLEEYDQRLRDMLDGRFTFLNRTLILNPIDWNRRYDSHLWSYHLHYFSYAVWCARAFVEQGNRRAMQVCQSLIESWIEQARIGHSDGWDPYPTSLRAVNWIYAYSLVAARLEDRSFLQIWRASIYRQLDFIKRHIEFQHLANHLLKNAKALVIGGLFFNQEEWLAKGERILWREFEEQVLADGGHYERSPMYHAQVMGDLLECYALLRSFDRITQTKAIEEKLGAMARFLDAMSYPDGTLALFNDSANSEETSPLPILETATRVVSINEKRACFPQTGYYWWLSRDGQEKIIVDAGPPSVCYNPAHAHCDVFSYEMWLGGRPFIVDSGVHGYGGDHFREYCRSTRAHNTVMFDGREQSEVWGTFRMGRRAELMSAEVTDGEKTWSFSGEYRPYYNPRQVHQRQISRRASGEWVFEDRLRSGNAERAMSFIHLHPCIQAEVITKKGLVIECTAGQMKATIEPHGAENVRIFKGDAFPIQGWYCPDFGVAKPNAAICIYYDVKRGEPFGYKIMQREYETNENRRNKRKA
jgi:uncharacterized heparinase superfamily protein